MTSHQLEHLAEAVGGAVRLVMMRQQPTKQFDWGAVALELGDDASEFLDQAGFSSEDQDLFIDLLVQVVAGGKADAETCSN